MLIRYGAAERADHDLGEAGIQAAVGYAAPGVDGLVGPDDKPAPRVMPLRDANIDRAGQHEFKLVGPRGKFCDLGEILTAIGANDVHKALDLFMAAEIDPATSKALVPAISFM